MLNLWQDAFGKIHNSSRATGVKELCTPLIFDKKTSCKCETSYFYFVDGTEKYAEGIQRQNSFSSECLLLQMTEILRNARLEPVIRVLVAVGNTTLWVQFTGVELQMQSYSSFDINCDVFCLKV